METKDLVIDDSERGIFRYHRSSLTSPRILELERERIFDRAEMGLRSPPRVDSYRGFYFVSFNEHIQDLRAYLAGAREYLDLVADQSEVGMKVSRGSNKYTVRSNWKLMVENSTDGYHLMPVHRTYFEYLSDLIRDIPEEGQTSLFENWDPGPVRSLGNGHAMGISSGASGRTVARWRPFFGEDTKEEIAGIRERLVERFGEERTRQIADTNHSLLIFPNLLINDFLFTFIRVLYPVAWDRTEVTTWNLVPAKHSPNLMARRLENFVTFQGPGGFATPDDVEAVESSQAGFQAREMGWSDVSRGMRRQASISDELQMRVFWRQWHGHLMGLDKVETAD